MFGFGINGDGWHRVDGKELDHLNEALREKLEDEDYQTLNVNATERGHTPFYGTALGDDDKDKTIRLYRVPSAETGSDDESDAVEPEYFYCLVLFRKGWAEAAPGDETQPLDEGVADTPSGDTAESDEQRENQEKVLMQELDGTSPPIHSMNAVYELSLFDPDVGELSKQQQEHILHYVRFFCEFVHSDERPFYVIDEDGEVKITPDGRKRLQVAREAAARDANTTHGGDLPPEPTDAPPSATQATTDTTGAVGDESDTGEVPSPADQDNTDQAIAKPHESEHAPPRADAERGDAAAAGNEPSSKEVADGSAEDRAEHSTESDDSGNDRRGNDLRPRWHQQPGPATEFADLDNAEAIVLARIAYGGAGFTAKFGVRANGMVEMKADVPELDQGEVDVCRPLRIYRAAFKFEIPTGFKTIYISQLNRLLQGVLPPKDELPAGVKVRDDVLEIRRLAIIPDVSGEDVAPGWRRPTRRFSKVLLAHCVGPDVVIDVSRARVPHDIECVNVMAQGLNGSATRFDGEVKLRGCSFVGARIVHEDPRKIGCALNLSNATLGGELLIYNCVIGPAHKRDGMGIRPMLPNLAFSDERPIAQLNLSGITTDADINVHSSCVFGSTSLSRSRLENLWIIDCSIIGDVQLSWLNAHIVQVSNTAARANQTEKMYLKRIGCLWARLDSERAGIRGSVLIGGSEVDKNIIFEGVLICDSIAVWQTAALSLEFRGVLGNSPSAAGSSSVLPVQVYGALAISETTVRTSITVRGTHVLRFGYIEVNSYSGKFNQGPVDRAFSTDQWPSRRGESRKSLDHEAGWKLADDGKVAVRDSRIGFDLAIAGAAARPQATLAARLDKRLLTSCEDGVDLEGISIGGDLDLRGLITPRDVRAENLHIQGHTRVGLESLLRELHKRVAETEAATDATQSPAEKQMREGGPATTDPAGIDAGERSRGPWWTEPDKATNILINARTSCRHFLMRTSRVEGDVRLDGLTARGSDKDTNAKSDVKGSVAIQACVIRGDLSFALKNGLASDEQFVVAVKQKDGAEEIEDRAGSGGTDRRHTYVLNTKPACIVPAYAHIQGGLNLTQSSCGHLLISGICFEAGGANSLDLASVSFHAFSTDRFELLDSPIDRRCDLDALKVEWWDIREDRFDDEVTLHSDDESVNIGYLLQLLESDEQVPRGTYTSVERSLLEQGEVVKAEKVRKQMWAKTAAKPIAETNETGPRRWMQMFSNGTRRLLQLGASKFGYGGNVALFSPLLWFAYVSVGLCVYVAAGLQSDAFEPSLLRSIERGEEPFVAHAEPGYLDAVLVAARATLPGLGLFVAEDFRASVEPLPWYGGLSVNHMMDLASVAGWVFWLLTAVVISLRVFRSAGLRSRQ